MFESASQFRDQTIAGIHHDLRRHCFPLRRFVVCLFFIFGLGLPGTASAFWLLNFQTASTLPPGSASFIGGTGGQYTSVGDPKETSFTPFLAHAGIRFGLAERLDVGYRLCTVALPYSSAGPTLGAETDFKFRLTSKQAPWQLALVGGVGFSYLDLSGVSKSAWAPGADLVLTHAVTEGMAASLNARYVYTSVPSASGGSSANHVQAAGGSVGLWLRISSAVAILPEVGLFDFSGVLNHLTTNGWGIQYGAVLSAKIW